MLFSFSVGPNLPFEQDRNDDNQDNQHGYDHDPVRRTYIISILRSCYRNGRACLYGSCSGCSLSHWWSTAERQTGKQDCQPQHNPECNAHSSRLYFHGGFVGFQV